MVWAERYAGYFYRKDEAQYAAVPHGAFACWRDAMDANYWGAGILDTLMKHHGKEMKWIYPSS